MKGKFILILAGMFSAAVALLSFNMSKGDYKAVDQTPGFYKIGHRGIRGLMPENTIPGMIAAVKAGANTLEMDIHITKDGKVMVYHDDSFDPAYTLMPDGNEIPGKERKKYLFYQMNYDQIRPFIIGTKKYNAFPEQQRLATYAPLLSELIDSVDSYTRINKLPPVNYLIEIKSGKATDGINQPSPPELVDRLMDVLKGKNLGKRLIIQSFDARPLQELHKRYPGTTLGYLTGDQNASFEQNIAVLGFKPEFYNPNLSLVTDNLVEQCHQQGIQVCPWTVNSVSEMKRMKSFKVDGIITDYPNYFSQLQ